MAEETLVKENLTDEMIETGAELTKALDRSGWPIVAALWLFDADINQWRMVLASPAVEETGPLAAYVKVGALLEELNRTLPLSGLSVVTPNDPTIRALSSSAYARGTETEGRRVHRTAVNGRFVDDAYLYRLVPVAPAA